jgi:ubiquinone/menaquinone biosynthesis C-methylase UbiE
MATATKPDFDYVLGSTSAEHKRLNRQGRLISKLTEHFLEQTGLAPGMRVLDVGSGVGDVALLAARAVGSSGQVVCVNTDASALAVAKERAAGAGLGNIVFETCDFYQYPMSVAFDAVIGRCVLLHQTEPVAALKAVLQHLRPGAIIAFQEPWFSQAFSYPKAPLFQKMIGWLHATVRASGLDGDIRSSPAIRV